MKELYELKEKLMDELKEQGREITKKPRMSAGDLDTVAKLTKSIDRLCDIMEDEGGEYSSAGNWNANMHGNYGDNTSYRGRRRDRMGRYTHNDGYSKHGDTVSVMEDLMRNASNDKEKDAIRRCIRDMKEG